MSSRSDAVPTHPDPGLCASCRHAQVITSSRGAVFYLCRLSFTDPGFRKYPTLPVITCPGFTPHEHHAR